MKIATLRSLAILTVAAAFAIPCHAAGKKITTSIPHFTKDVQIPNSRQINF